MKRETALLVLALALVGCDRPGSPGTAKNAQSDSKFDPCEALRQMDPHCDWKPHRNHIGPSTNPIDGTKTEFLSLDSSDADGLDAGRLHYAQLRICFQNPKLCTGKTITLSLNFHCMVLPI